MLNLENDISKIYFSKKITHGKRINQTKWCQINESSRLRNQSAGIFNYKCSNFTYHHLEPRLSLYNRVNKLDFVIYWFVKLWFTLFIRFFLFLINKSNFKSGIMAGWKNSWSSILIFKLRIWKCFCHRVTLRHLSQRLIESLKTVRFIW